MLKKTIVSMALCGSILAAGMGIASATIAKDEVQLGGISPFGMNRGSVSRIYGNPTREEYGGAVWHYGNSVKISFQEGSLSSVTVTANNGWTTPAGLAVGMEADEAIALYGDPDESADQGSKRLYVYYINAYERGRGHLGVVFDKDSQTITKLNVYKSKMADYREYYPGWKKNMLS